MAFKLVRLYSRDVPRMRTYEKWEGFLNGRTREIERLFRVGEATPHDVDLDGRTLLHVRNHQTFLHCAKIHR